MSHSHLASGTGFLQVKHAYLKNMLEICNLHPPSMGLWIWLTYRANRMNEVCANEAQICQGAEMCRSTLYKAYAILEERKFIERDRAGIIYLNAAIVWRGTRPGSHVLARLNCKPILPEAVSLPAAFRG